LALSTRRLRFRGRSGADGRQAVPLDDVQHQRLVQHHLPLRPGRFTDEHHRVLAQHGAEQFAGDHADKLLAMQRAGILEARQIGAEFDQRALWWEKIHPRDGHLGAYIFEVKIKDDFEDWVKKRAENLSISLNSQTSPDPEPSFLCPYCLHRQCPYNRSEYGNPNLGQKFSDSVEAVGTDAKCQR